MPLNEIFQKRFEELEDQYNRLPWRQNIQGSGKNVPSGAWQQWATSTLNIIRAVYSENSPHYAHFVSGIEKCTGYDYQIDVLHGVFLSAKEDFERGYVFNIDLKISGEVFGDFIAMARQSLSEGHKDVAAVLACAALEDALKKYADINGLAIDDNSMNEVVNALKGKGLVSGAQKSLLSTMPKIRNYAMHANWDKISAPDVSSVIGFVEQFLLSKFSH